MADPEKWEVLALVREKTLLLKLKNFILQLKGARKLLVLIYLKCIVSVSAYIFLFTFDQQQEFDWILQHQVPESLKRLKIVVEVSHVTQQGSWFIGRIIGKVRN
jgi:hypothetical protein